MRRPTRRAAPKLAVALLAGGAIALASLAQADAPAGQYDLFGRYAVTIHDLNTDLIWERSYAATTMSFDGAAAYCGSLSLSPYGSGWRVPSYKELLTLVDEHPHFETSGGTEVQKAIDANAFYGTPSDLAFWTSSVYPGSTTVGGVTAYVVNFKDGSGAYTASTGTFYVRCVHDDD